MLPEIDITESESLGFYISFEELFPDFYPFLNEKEKKFEIEVNFLFTDEETPPNEGQIAACEFLLKHSNQMLHNLVGYLKQDEEYFMEFYTVYRKITYEQANFRGEMRTYTRDGGFPAVDAPREYLKYFGISHINISNSSENGMGYIGFAGGCPWDPEHDFGAAFHKADLLHVEDYSYGKHPSWGARSNKEDRFLTESFTHFHKLEDLSVRKARIAEESKSIQVENSEGYEKLFEWLAKHQKIYGYRNRKADISVKEKVFMLNEITELSFYGDTISAIPDEIYLLENLSSLSFKFNHATAIPRQIFGLKKLKQFDFSNNKINELPKEIGNLQNLEYLQLGRNALLVIPEEIGQLAHLKNLDISSNRLAELPNSFSKLTELTSFKLSFNAFETFPDAVSHLTKLIDLQLNRNKLHSLPESIHTLENLQYLDLSYNELNTLPKSLFKSLKSVRNFKIQGNPFAAEDIRYFQRWVHSEASTDFELALSSAESKEKQAPKVSQQRNTNTRQPAKKWWEFWK